MPPKDKPKEKSSGLTSWNLATDEFIIALFFLLIVLGSLVPFILNFLTSGDFSFYGFKLSGIYDFFRSNLGFFKLLGFTLAGAGAVGTFVLARMADAVWLAEKAKLFPANVQTLPAGGVSAGEPIKDQMLERWERIIKLSESENQSDWRFAIIEADIILDELLDKLQLPGETMGEKLQAVEKSDFLTIDSAWEAHKARNMIAHEGSSFLLNQREIRRIISLYEAVFKEFHLI